MMYKQIAGILVGLFSCIPILAFALSTSELQVQIQSLMAQVELLKTQVTGSLSSPASNARCPILYRALSLGARGSDVSALQEFLAGKALLSADSVTGYFGPLTREAVRTWQSQQGIASSGDESSTGWGMVGVRTRSAIQTQCANTNSEIRSSPTQIQDVRTADQNGSMRVILRSQEMERIFNEFNAAKLASHNWLSRCATSSEARASLQEKLRDAIAALVNFPALKYTVTNVISAGYNSDIDAAVSQATSQIDTYVTQTKFPTNEDVQKAQAEYNSLKASCRTFDELRNKDTWSRVEVSTGFSILLPPGMVYNRKQGIDSFVGEFAGDGIRISFDYGWYGGAPSPGDYPSGTFDMMRDEIIDGYPVKIWTRTGSPSIGMYMQVDERNGLNMGGGSENYHASVKEIVLDIFRSVDIK